MSVGVVSRSAPRVLAGGVRWLFVGAFLPGCLLSSEFERAPEKRESDAARSTGSAAAARCENDEYSCVLGELRRCVDGAWTHIARCGSDQICSSSFGDCLLCEPEVDTRCGSGQLLECDADGQSYRLLADCVTEGRLCDVDLSPRACIDCRPSDRRCDGDLLLRCVDGVFRGGTSCGSGLPCQAVDGFVDYCAECSRPGEEACGANRRVTCTEQRKLELLEECPNGCVLEGTETRCL